MKYCFKLFGSEWKTRKFFYSEEVWLIYSMGSVYVQSHWINCFEVSFESKFNDFPCIIFFSCISQMTSQMKVKIGFV